MNYTLTQIVCRAFVWSFIFSCGLYMILGYGALALGDVAYQYNETGTQCYAGNGRGFANGTFAGYKYVGDTVTVGTQSAVCSASGLSNGATTTNWWRGCSNVDIVAGSPGTYLHPHEDTWANLPSYTIVNADRGYPVWQYAYCGPSNAMLVGIWYQVRYGSAPAPTANFACDNVYSSPSPAEISCTDLSTDLPTSWEFYVYDEDGDQSYPGYVEDPWVFDLHNLGDYDVRLKGCNSAGCDWENKSDYLHIQMFENWTPTPTPTYTPVPWTNITTLNMSYMQEMSYGNSTIGQLYQPWFDFWNYFLGFVEEIVISVQDVLNWPFNRINNQMEGLYQISGATVFSLLSYTTVPLLLMGKVINIIPWQIQSLITMLLVFEVIIIISRGRQ